MRIRVHERKMKIGAGTKVGEMRRRLKPGPGVVVRNGFAVPDERQVWVEGGPRR